MNGGKGGGSVGAGQVTQRARRVSAFESGLPGNKRQVRNDVSNQHELR